MAVVLCVMLCYRHVLVLRSRPDGYGIIGKPKITEKMIAKRYFKRYALQYATLYVLLSLVHSASLTVYKL
jgi:hypothetical protein